MRFEKLGVGTTNPGKIVEIRDRLAIPELELVSLSGDAPETGITFLDNATEKALWYSEKYPNLPVLSDDSGIIVEDFHGYLQDRKIALPGVFSGRFYGIGLSYSFTGDLLINDRIPEKKIPTEVRDLTNRTRLLKILADRQFRSSTFICAMVIALNGEVLFRTKGRVDGELTTEEYGKNKFGYDPIFIPKVELDIRDAKEACRFSYEPKTFGQFSLRKKQKISHRGRALREVKKWLENEN